MGGWVLHIDKDLVAASATPLVLAILAEGENYGYAILKRVRELSGGELEWTDGMLYPLLHSPPPARVRNNGVADAAGRASPQLLRDHRRRANSPRGAAAAVGDRHPCVG
jgi:PadR family transcriptional regulator PadR